MSSIAIAGSGGGSSGITINTTTITGGTDKHVLYDNAGTVGEMANFTNVSGNPNVIATNAYLYNSVIIAQALTSLRNWYLAGAGNLSTTANDDIGIGSSALTAINVGDGVNGRNVAIGTFALQSGTNVLGNLALGWGALSTVTTANNNVAIGQSSLGSATGGSNNVGLGSATLSKNTTGGNNSALGSDALFSNTTGSGNSADGFTAMQFNTTGANNFAMGTAALQQNIDGGGNVGIGFQALNGNDHGSSNIAIGGQSLDSLVGGSSLQNTSIGSSSGQGLASGADSNNVFIGYHAGNSITAGSGNVCIGSQIVGPSGTANNTISIGTGDGNIHLDYNFSFATKWFFSNPIALPAFTVGTLPVGVAGAQVYITDGDAGLAWGATAVNSGAGATKYMVWYNGANWTVMGK